MYLANKNAKPQKQLVEKNFTLFVSPQAPEELQFDFLLPLVYPYKDAHSFVPKSWASKSFHEEET